MPWYAILAPFVGAIALEVVSWYLLRTRLDKPQYQKLLKSVGYWVITVLMVLVGALGALFLFWGRLEVWQLFIAGAAFPTLFKKLVSAFITDQTKLGASEAPSPLRDYFRFG